MFKMVNNWNNVPYISFSKKKKKKSRKSLCCILEISIVQYHHLVGYYNVSVKLWFIMVNQCMRIRILSGDSMYIFNDIIVYLFILFYPSKKDYLALPSLSCGVLEKYNMFKPIIAQNKSHILFYYNFFYIISY